MTRKLLFINGLAIIGVVLFHAVGMGFVAMFSWAERYLAPGVSVMSQVGNASYYGLRFVEQLVIPCIPIFLFISGYFVSAATARSRSTVSWQVVFSRIRNLLIPYVIWSVVVLILRYVEGDRFSALHLSGILLTGSANEVMYFVPLLTQFYLLSPFIIVWAKKNWVSLIVIASILQVLVQLTHYPLVNEVVLPIGDGINVFIPKWFFLSRIFWFPLGVVIGLQRKIYMQFILRYKWIWLVGAILFYLAAFMEWELLYRNSGEQWLAHIETNIDNLYSIAVLFLLLALNSSLGRWYSWISEVGTKSYGIYLTHAIFIMYTARIIYHSAPGLLAYQLVLQPILIAVGLGVPLALMAITDRTLLRRWYSYLYG